MKIKLCSAILFFSILCGVSLADEPTKTDIGKKEAIDIAKKVLINIESTYSSKGPVFDINDYQGIAFLKKSGSEIVPGFPKSDDIWDVYFYARQGKDMRGVNQYSFKVDSKTGQGTAIIEMGAGTK